MSVVIVLFVCLEASKERSRAQRLDMAAARVGIFLVELSYFYVYFLEEGSGLSTAFVFAASLSGASEARLHFVLCPFSLGSLLNVSALARTFAEKGWAEDGCCSVVPKSRLATLVSEPLRNGSGW